MPKPIKKKDVLVDMLKRYLRSIKEKGSTYTYVEPEKAESETRYINPIGFFVSDLDPSDPRFVSVMESQGGTPIGEAEVVAQFEPRDDKEAAIYKNLGVQGVLDYREMNDAVRAGRDQFAEDYMRPVLEAALWADGAAGLASLGSGSLKLGAAGLKNIYKINPFATRTIPTRPDHYYRVVPGEAYDDLIQSGVVRARSTPAPEGASLLEQVNYRPTSSASFAKGRAMPEYGKGDPRAVVIEAGPRGGAWMNRSTPINPVTGTRTPRPSGRHFADFALDPKTGKMIDIPISDVTNIYRATPHPIKGYIKVN